MSQEKNSEQSEGMYSYKSDNEDNNNNKIHQNEINNNVDNNFPPAFESDAIRRSNPNINEEISQKPKFENNFYQSGMLKGNLQSNGTIPLRVSQASIEIPQDSILHWSFVLIYLILEVLLIITIATVFNWDKRNHPYYSCINNININTTEFQSSSLNNIELINNRTILNELYIETENELSIYSGLFRDINIMAFVGFGMLHTLTKGNSWASIGFNILSIVLSFQISLFFNLIFENAFNEEWHQGILNFDTFIKALFNSCAILVSFGGLHGKISHVQYLVLIISETILCSLNFKLCDVKMKIIDTGGGLYIHTFGAIFGLAIYIVLFRSRKKRQNLGNYTISSITNNLSNVTCFIGALFLIHYFPPLNAGLALTEHGRYRAVINTYFSLIGSIALSFITSGFFHKEKFNFEEIIFGSFSGGVIVSCFSAICLDHWAALLIGMLYGFICVILFEYLKKLFINIGFYDIYNIIIVHAIPGILSAFISSMFLAGLKHRKVNDYHSIEFKDIERSARSQAAIQIGAIFVTLALSFVGGITAGFLIKVARCGKIRNFFDDDEFFAYEMNGNNFNDNVTNYDDNNQPSFMNEHSNVK